MKWHHIGIYVRNLADSTKFYEDVFDFTFEQFLTFPGEKIAFLKKGEVRIELLESEEIPVPCRSIHFAWQVESIEEWLKKLSAKGFNPSEGPYHLENGWVSVFYEGLDNEIIELIQVTK